jgi:uncharacterized membrane protein YfcA
VIYSGLVLFVTALLGGTMNSVAGGGSFLTFPALILTGVAPITANATSTVALWPGSVASAGAYRRELGRAQHVRLLSAVSLLGGIAGALLLLHTPSSAFQRLIPWLLLLATALFAFGPALTARVRARTGRPGKTGHPQGVPLPVGGIAVVQFVIAIYGGYFGGGIGILMLAALGLMGLDNINEANAVKTLLASFINGIAVLTFIAARAVAWPQALLMLVGAIVGGYGGAATARRLPPLIVRRVVIAIGSTMTLYFFIHG